MACVSHAMRQDKENGFNDEEDKEDGEHTQASPDRHCHIDMVLVACSVSPQLSRRLRGKSDNAREDGRGERGKWNGEWGGQKKREKYGIQSETMQGLLLSWRGVLKRAG